MSHETELERITRLIEQQRQRAVADLDHGAAGSLAELAVSGCAFEPGAAELLGRCYQASRAREKRLEALVRSLAQHGTPAPGQFAWWHKAVEAAQKELENG